MEARIIIRVLGALALLASFSGLVSPAEATSAGATAPRPALAYTVMNQSDAHPFLGSPSEMFIQLLGSPNDNSGGGDLHFQRCQSTADQFVVAVAQGHAWTILRQPCRPASPSVAERLREATQFLPPDAVAGSPFTSERGEPGRQYVSASLADVVPADMFQDCDGNLMPPGTFLVLADQSGGWLMGIGTCP